MKDGFFKLQRKLLESDLWLKEPFTRGQAWVDLIGLANFADVEKFDGANIHVYKRGQVVTSYGTLAKRWKWSVNRVRRYIDTLKTADMIKTTSTKNGTVLTITNYKVYQDPKTVENTGRHTTRNANRHTDGTTDGTTDGITSSVEKCGFDENWRHTNRHTDGITNGTTLGTTDGTQIKKDKEEKKERIIYTPTAKQTKTTASSVRVDYGGVWLTDAEWDELEAMVSDKEALLDIIDRAGEWLQNNPRPKNRHKGVVITFLRNDGLI